ncbi:hypothetical protein J4Q44_G00236980 [Coregonus suidteri]|uniref:Matrin-type domain-containing protein n=1 Tax=Coregonus suidteri TaxID=861788 RepID=A0AAN8LBM4_9TELE
MFGHQQQQQRIWQLQQHLQQRQQLQTTQFMPSQLPHQYQMNRPPSPSMINLCPVPRAPLLATNPMLQGALLMQQPMRGNMRGLAMGSGLPFTSFLAEGARQSLLGPAPIPQVGLSSSGPYHSHAHILNKDICVRKRENERTGSAGGQLSSSSAEGPGERGDRTTNTEMEDTESDGQLFAKQQEEPEMKKPKMNGSEEPVNITIGQEPVPKSDNRMPTDVSKPVDISAVEYRGGSTSIQVAEECCEESITAEHVLGVGTSLKVTIQQSSESRAFSTGLEELAAATGTPCGVGGQGEDSDRGAASDSHYCYICSLPYHNQQNFQSHMNGVEHQQCMMEIQQVSNACLVNLLPLVGNSLQGTHKAGGKKTGGVRRWCATCQTHFTGDLIEHRRTKEHKLSKQSSRPFCTVCKRHFRTPRKFVEHMKSREHKRQVAELREEGEPEVLEELITVDAVGCFEGEDDFEEETQEDEDSRGAQPGQRAVPLEQAGDYEAFDSETQYGSSFVVPVAGFLCRLCHKFFYFESTARHIHCKSLMHFQNLQKYKALKNQKSSAAEDTAKTRTCSRTVGDSPDLRDSRDNKEVIQVENDCNMARDNTHPCGTSSTTIEMHPVVSTQDEAEQDNISTATPQVSEQLDSDSVLPNTAVAVYRPCGCATQPPSGSSSGLENMVKPPPCQRSQPSLQEYGHDVTGEKSSCRGGCALALPAGQQNTNMSMPQTASEPPRGSLLEREHLQQESATLLMPHILKLDEDRELVNREELELEESAGMGPGKLRRTSKRMVSKTKSTRTTHTKT